MNILVTGGCGYIGDCAVGNLVRAGCNVTVVDKLLYSDSYMRPDVMFINMDINSSDFEALLLNNKFDAIVHLAAIVGDGACNVSEPLTHQTNVRATETIVNVIKTRSPETRFIFASTCSVYGDNDALLNENSRVRPLSLYAESKLDAEYTIRDSGIKNAVVFRLGTLFGLSSPFARIRADLVANILTYKACRGEQLTVFGGEQWRPLIHVKDVGRVFAEAVFRDYTGTIILSGQNYKISEVGDKIARIVGGEVAYTDMKFEDLRNYKVDNSLAAKLGIFTHITLDEGVAEMARVVAHGRIKNPWLLQYHNAKYLKEIMRET